LALEPTIAILLIESDESPVLVSVIVWLGLLVPSCSFPKFKLVGERLTTGPSDGARRAETRSMLVAGCIVASDGTDDETPRIAATKKASRNKQRILAHAQRDSTVGSEGSFKLMHFQIESVRLANIMGKSYSDEMRKSAARRKYFT
jgi:hypothetical protein